MLFFVMSGVEPTGAEEQALDSIEMLNWNYRVILVHSPSGQASGAVEEFARRHEELTDRDIAWFVLSGEKMGTNYPGKVDPTLGASIRETYFMPPPAETAFVLIGKDGGVKSRGESLDLESMFALIDSMPMRQAEMNQARER